MLNVAYEGGRKSSPHWSVGTVENKFREKDGEDYEEKYERKLGPRTFVKCLLF